MTNFAQILQFVTSLKRICTLFCISFSVSVLSVITVSVSFVAVSRLRSVDCFICINGFKLSVCFCASLPDLAEFARFAMTTENNNIKHVSATDNVSSRHYLFTQSVASYHELTDTEYEVRLPSLNRSNGWTAAMFRTLLIVHGGAAVIDTSSCSAVSVGA